VRLPSAILDCWLQLSSNAAKLIIWIAREAKRGVIKITLEDIAKTFDWSKSTARRTREELVSKNLIYVTSATNQHGVTAITILDFALSRPEQGSEPSTRTEESSALSNQLDSELGALAMPEYGTDGRIDGPALPRVEQGKPSIVMETKTKSHEHLADKIADGGHLAGELTDAQRRALEHLGFECDRRHISFGFAAVAEALYRLHGERLSPGKFAGQIIRTCLEEQNALRTAGKDPTRYCWPVGFRKWRGVLRDRETLAEQVHAAAVAV